MDHQISKNYPISKICIDPHKNPNIYVIYVKLDKNTLLVAAMMS